MSSNPEIQISFNLNYKEDATNQNVNMLQNQITSTNINNNNY